MIKQLRLFIVFLLCILFISSTWATEKFNRRTLCQESGYYCLKVEKHESWQSLFPNPKQRRIVMRLNRMNTGIYPGLTIAVPENLGSIDHLDVSPFPKRIEPPGQETLFINLAAQAFGAYDEEGYLQHWGPVSAGRGWCPDIKKRCTTPRGEFFVFSKGTSNCKSAKYPIGKGGAPMPYCMYFYGGYALHASFLPGHHASHGCIRLFFEDAQWLNDYFIDKGKNGTKIVVSDLSDQFLNPLFMS